jgi:SHS2 domain-containing protein
MSYSYPDEGPPADLLIAAEAKTLGETFAQVAYAMFEIITPLEGIAEKEEFTLEATGHDLESLLFNIMDEFLYINDVEFLVPKKIDLVVDIENLTAVAKCIGERFSRDTHETGIAVKAVTYHMMIIKETDDGWYVRMVFDT